MTPPCATDRDGLAAVALGQPLDGGDHPPAQRVVALPARDAVPPAGPGPLEPLRVAHGGPPAELSLAPVAEQHLLEVGVLLDGQAAGDGQGGAGVDGALEVGGVDGIDGLGPQPVGQGGDLRLAVGVEARVGRPPRCPARRRPSGRGG